MADAGAQQSRDSGGVVGRVVEIATPLVPTLIGAVSLLGFVAAVGAALDWVRFDAAGLPADQAVRVIDRSELIATGAMTVASFAVFAVLAVLVAYLLDSEGDPSRRLRVGIALIALAELLVAVAVAHPYLWVYPLVAVGFLAFAGAVDALIAPHEKRRAARAARQRLTTRLSAAREELRSAHGEVLAGEASLACPPTALVTSAEREAVRAAQRRRALAAYRLRLALAENDRAQDASAPAPLPGPEPCDVASYTALDEAARVALDLAAATPAASRPSPSQPAKAPSGAGRRAKIARAWERHLHVVLIGAAVVVVALSLVGAPLVLRHYEDVHWLGVMGLAVLVINAAVYGVARISSRFRWYGLAVFVSVIVFGATLGLERTHRSPKLQPVALIRTSSDRPVCGIYIAETDKRIYLARVELRDHTDQRGIEGAGRIFWIPEDDVDMIKVGPAQSIANANGRAPRLADELFQDRAEAKPQKVRRTTTRPLRTRKAMRKYYATSPRGICTRVSAATLVDDARTGAPQRQPPKVQSTSKATS